MLLKIGELAKHTGLTVRTLHHYDAIDLLKPSHRSESDYRLYSREDVARLHGIQTLRHLGLPLNEIASLLNGQGADPLRIVQQQMLALDQEIARSTELRARLALMHERLEGGGQPDMTEWLSTLSLMTTYSKYFSAVELRQFFRNLKPLELEWRDLIAEVRKVMDGGCQADSIILQPLVTRWMGLVQQTTGGDADLMERWGQMFQQEPGIHGRGESPQSDMIELLHTAMEQRLALLSKYLSAQELRNLGWVAHADWMALDAEVAELIRNKVEPGSPGAMSVVAQWSALINRVTGNNNAVRDKLLFGYAMEPLLRAGSVMSAAVQGFIRESLQKVLDPNAA